MESREADTRFTVVATLLLAIPLLAGAGGTTRYRVHGDVVRFTGCGGTVCGGLDVQRGYAGSEDATFLWFNVYDYATGDYAYGYGRIPSTDLTVSSTAHASLDTDTTNNPDIEIIECISSACVRVPGGRITARWDKNGFSSSAQSVHWKEVIGSLRRTTTGVYRYDSADASGSVLGREFPAALGEVGAAQSVDVRVEPGL
jgi:hypothetical protein